MWRSNALRRVYFATARVPPTNVAQPGQRLARLHLFARSRLGPPFLLALASVDNNGTQSDGCQRSSPSWHGQAMDATAGHLCLTLYMIVTKPSPQQLFVSWSEGNMSWLPNAREQEKKCGAAEDIVWSARVLGRERARTRQREITYMLLLKEETKNYEQQISSFSTKFRPETQREQEGRLYTFSLVPSRPN